MVTGLRFAASSSYDKTSWSNLDRETSDHICSIHFGLSNNVISPKEATEEYNLLCIHLRLNTNWNVSKSEIESEEDK